MRLLPDLEGRALTEMDVTLAGMRTLLLLYNRPEQTFLLPPSTAHWPESAPANDEAPGRPDAQFQTLIHNFPTKKKNYYIFIFIINVINQHKL